MTYYDESKFPDVDRHELLCAKNAHLPVAIESYADALWWWKQRQNWRGSNDRPVAAIDDGRRRMRMRDDKSIEFEYNGHVLCVWRPDKTISVSPHQGYPYSAFDRFVMPRTIEVGRTTQLGGMIYLKIDPAAAYTRVKLETETGTRFGTNPDVWVVRGDGEPVNLSFDKDEDRWTPTNEYHCKPFEWFELDKSRLREASEKYNIATFIRAIETAMQMGAEIATASDYGRYDPATKYSESGEDILTLLEEERFVEAAALVRVNVERTYNGNGTYTEEKNGFKSTDIKRIRGLAYAEMGLLYIETDRVVDLKKLTTIENKLRDYGKPA